MVELFNDDLALPHSPANGSAMAGAAPQSLAAARAHVVAYRVLARTYRPNTFEDLIGQDAMVRTLRNAFASGRVAHAFMLTGVRGIGKTTTARIIARCLNCVGVDGTGGPTTEPCGTCVNCRAILADCHPDVIEMDAASKTGIDDVREIIEATRFKPMQARIKVFIIDEVHMLSKAAFNALLKTLEEPPPHVKFVFATTELRKVPVTVLSRCQRFELRRVSVETLVSRFVDIAAREQVFVSPEALDMIARAADGSVRDGLSLLDQAIAQAGGETVSSEIVATMLGTADRTLIFDLLEAVLGGSLPTVLEITDRGHALGVDFSLLLQDLLELIHVLARLQSVPALRGRHHLPEAERIRGAILVDRVSMPELARCWQMLLKGLAEIETAPDQRAAAEMVLIRLCHLADLPQPGDLVRRLRESTTELTATGEGSWAGTSQTIANGAPACDTHRGRQFSGLGDIAAAVAADRTLAPLHAHLVHSVHIVHFAQGVIEFRPAPDAPRTLAADLGAFLLEQTRQRWTVAVSTEIGERTLAAQGEAADRTRRETASAHPLVRAALETFPGATISFVGREGADRSASMGVPVAGAGFGDLEETIDPTVEMEVDLAQSSHNVTGIPGELSNWSLRQRG